MKHPDLFDQPPDDPQIEEDDSSNRGNVAATVLPFPLGRDVGRARKMAAMILTRRSPGAQQAQFDRDALAVGRKLRMAGLAEVEVARQIDALTAAVNAELQRRQYGRRQTPQGQGQA